MSFMLLALGPELLDYQTATMLTGGLAIPHVADAIRTLYDPALHHLLMHGSPVALAVFILTASLSCRIKAEGIPHR